jgi:dihydrofolate reductase
MNSKAMAAPTIKIIVAYSTNRAIGKDNALPWRLKGDLAHFKRTTMGCPIIMGRNTWESLGRPLPGRQNLVISRNPDLVAGGATVCHSLAAAVDECVGSRAVFVIGGAQIYRQALDMADEIIATEVHANIDGDAFFPALPDGRWVETERAPQPAEQGLDYDFVTYRRISAVS